MSAAVVLEWRDYSPRLSLQSIPLTRQISKPIKIPGRMLIQPSGPRKEQEPRNGDRLRKHAHITHSTILLVFSPTNRAFSLLGVPHYHHETHENEIPSSFKTWKTFAYATASRNRKPVAIIASLPSTLTRGLDTRQEMKIDLTYRSGTSAHKTKLCKANDMLETEDIFVQKPRVLRETGKKISLGYVESGKVALA